MKKWLIGAASLAVFSATAASAETAEETASVFGARQSVLSSSLSPSGKRLAYVAPYSTQGEALYVVDLTSQKPPAMAVVFNEELADLTSCTWVTEDRLICRASMLLLDSSIGKYLGFSRSFAVNSDGSDIDVIEAPRSLRTYGFVQGGGSLIALDVAGEDGNILMTRQYQEQSSLNTRLASSQKGLGVVQIDIDNGKEKQVLSPDDNAVRFIADDKGEIRVKGTQRSLATGYASDQLNYFYRPLGSAKWEQLSSYTMDAQTGVGFWPAAVDAKSNSVFGFEKGAEGFEEVVSIVLDGSNARTTVLSQVDADVDGLVTIGRQRRVVGASYATEKRLVEYFDPELKALASSLAQALPDTPLIGFGGASADERALLLTASSDTNPGMLYLFEKGTNQLGPLLPLREEAEGRSFSKMQPVSFPAADGTMIPGYLTLPVGSNGKNLPAIVLPHGGPSARDEWGFDWLVQFFAARGYAVLQPNFRGSSGYGDAWFGRNGFQAWETAVGDVNDAARWLVDQGIANPAKLAAVGWSYGGYAALQTQVLDPALYKAIVAIAPVTDLEMLREENKMMSNYELVDKFIGRGPHVQAGSPAKNAERFTSPVLLFHGTADVNVDVGQSRSMENALKSAGKQVTLIEFDKFAHGLDDSAVRTQMLTQIDGFLAASLGQ